MNKRRLLPYAAISFVVFVWGLSFLSIKVVMEVMGPMTLALSRFTIASILLWGILKFREPGSQLAKTDIPRMAVSGVIGICIYFFFENNGVNLTTASTASIIIATIPMLTAIADHIFCGNRITVSKLLGVVMSFIGVFLIVGSTGRPSFSSSYFVGNLLMMGAAFAWVAYSLLTRPLGQKYSRLAITTYQTLFGTLAIMPFVFTENNTWQMINFSTVLNIVFLGVLCSAAGYFLYVYAIGELGVDIPTLFINLIPVVTVIGGYFILGEKITPIQLTGGGIILASVYLADLKNWFGKNTMKIPGQISKG